KPAFERRALLLVNKRDVGEVGSADPTGAIRQWAISVGAMGLQREDECWLVVFGVGIVARVSAEHRHRQPVALKHQVADSLGVLGFVARKRPALALGGD